MNLYLLSLVFFLSPVSSKTPNFYPSYIAAKEASKNYQKDLVIFFSKNSCAECEAAWGNFEKDQLATKIFISTLIDAQDFDGAVILDKYGLNNAPSWVILDSEGNVKQKWAGEWKNPHVRPAPGSADASNVEPKPEPKPVPVFKPTLASGSTTETTHVVKTQEAPVPAVTEKAINTPSSTPEVTTTAPVALPAAPAVSSAFVLQAGYFGSETNAQKLKEDLNGKGFSGYMIKSVDQNGTPFYRVISSGFATESEASKAMEALSSAGFKASIKKAIEI